MDYVEEKEFTLRLQVRRSFPEDYEGDDDGYAWWEGFPSAALVRAAIQVAVQQGYSARTANRGRPADEEVTLVLERTG